MQPYCVYCGGTVRASQVDHMPPISLFALRRRPEGLEFSVCPSCHLGTRRIDAATALISRMYPSFQSEGETEEVRRLIHGVAKHSPIFKRELDHAIRHAQAEYRVGDIDGVALQLGEPITAMLEAFAARMGLAFHYLATGSILPESGGIVVKIITNVSAMRGDLPNDIWDAFPSLWALRQKGLAAHESFQFGFVKADDFQGSASIGLFRQSFAALAFCAEKPEELGADYAEHLFRPGFLVGLPY